MRAPPSPLRLALRCSGRVHRGSDATVVGSRRDVADSLRWCSALSSGRSVEFAGAPLPAAPAVEELEGCCSARRADSQAIATSRPTVVATATRRARPCCLSRQIDMNAVKRRLRERPKGKGRSRPLPEITGDGEVTPSSRPAAAGSLPYSRLQTRLADRPQSNQRPTLSFRPRGEPDAGRANLCPWRVVVDR
jgi:hypothetical protein